MYSFVYLILAFGIDIVWNTFVVEQVDLPCIETPRDEHDAAVLSIERKQSHVQRTVRRDCCRKCCRHRS